jgi:hypothetical protein
MDKITILAMFAIFAGVGVVSTAPSTVLAQTDNATMGANMTGGNMTAGSGNLTDANMTEAVGQISGGPRCGGTCYLEE